MAGRDDSDQRQLQRAFSLYESGALSEAAAILSAYLKRGPLQPPVLHLLGIIEARQGNPKRAARFLERYLELIPRDPVAHTNRGNVLRDLKKPREALRSYERAIEIDPRSVSAHSNRGAVLAELGLFDQAFESYQRSLELDPRNSEAHFNSANLLAELRRFAKALDAYDLAISLAPASAQYHNNRGVLLADLGRLQEAITSYDAAIALQPGLADAHNNRGLALQRLGRLEEAIAAFDRTLALDPEYPYALGKRLHLKSLTCDWRDFSSERDSLGSACRAGRQVVPPFEALALFGAAETQYAAARSWTKSKFSLIEAAPAVMRRDAKIRVAYLASEFREHPVAFLAAELFELHDRDRFEVLAVSWGADEPSDIRARIKRSADAFIDISDYSNRRAAELLRELGIGIAVDLNGYTGEWRTEVFAHRAAPIQINYLGLPGTMGAPFIDYLVADSFVIQPDERKYYAEKLIVLPDSFQANDSKRRIADSPLSREQVGLPSEAFVFCCFSNGHKLNAETFDIWVRLLRQVERSVLWLAGSNPWLRANLAQEAEARGVARERIVFAPHAEYAEHLARYQLADLCLDTFPFNGGTTTSDALWAGLPVLTRAGSSYAGRMAGSLLHAIGLPELVAASPAEYEKIALGLAQDRDRLLGLRQRLERNRLERPLFDSRRFAGYLDAAYAHIWDRAQRGLPPEDFTAPSA
jgi:predicted O-linked N-acetylglucosamine transferase (SPINDLY family)